VKTSTHRQQTFCSNLPMKPLSQALPQSPIVRTVIALSISALFTTQGLASEVDSELIRFTDQATDRPHREPVSTAMPVLPASDKSIVAISINLDRATAPADGQSPVSVQVKLFNDDGKPIQTKTTVTIETSGGRILLDGAQTDVQGPRGGDADFATTGTQLVIENGEAQFQLLAPTSPQDVILRVSTDRLSSDSAISFLPELRDWIAVGLIEGIIALRRNKSSGINQVRVNDGFEQELRHFEREFNNGRGRVGSRAAFFVKGTIKGKYLLSASYDSDKETRARMLRDIRAEEIYPVYGDASIRGSEALSGTKLFIRVSRNKSYVLYGDFQTNPPRPTAVIGNTKGPVQRVDLGAHNRTLTGAKLHLEGKNGHLDVYAVRDSLRQRVDEIVPNGTSGPYGLSTNTAVENTERVELIIRDRARPGQILETRLLQRFVDYTFEPFAGRLLFKSPITRTDEFGNLQSIRVSYEQDGGGESNWSAGVSGSADVTDRVSIGGSYHRNDLDSAVTATPEVTDLASVNVGVRINDHSSITAELARSEAISANVGGATQTTNGNAARVEIRAGSETGRWSASAHGVKTDTGFANPSASAQQGRSELGASGIYNVTETVGVRGEIQKSSDDTSNAEVRGAYLGLTIKPSKRLLLSAGIRHIDDNGNGLLNPITLGSNGSVYGGTGLNTSGGGLFGDGAGTLNPANGNPIGSGTLTGTPLSANTLQLGASWQATDKFQLGAEIENSISGDDAWRAAARASWEFAERTKLNARYELQTGLGGYYDRNEESRALVLGISRGFLETGETFAEYRLRDAQAGREAQIAHGLRNTFNLGDSGWRALASLERLSIVSGANREATAIAVGADYPGGNLWKASARVEARRLDDNPATVPNDPADSLLATMSAARKLSRSWTGLGRVYTLRSDDRAIAGNQSQIRFLLGGAYRPVDTNRFDALTKLEYRKERNGELATPERRDVWIASLHTNYHPSRPWWFSTRLAAKSVNETLAGVADKYSAWLLGGRIIYDVTEKWDLGLMASMLSSPQGNARQWAAGLETGYTLRRNLWLSVGYNWTGFSDRDLTGSDYTAQGLFIRLRYKFDEDIFRGSSHQHR